jgi:hypothetical protein
MSIPWILHTDEASDTRRLQHMNALEFLAVLAVVFTFGPTYMRSLKPASPFLCGQCRWSLSVRTCSVDYFPIEATHPTALYPWWELLLRSFHMAYSGRCGVAALASCPLSHFRVSLSCEKTDSENNTSKKADLIRSRVFLAQSFLLNITCVSTNLSHGWKGRI